MALTYDKVEEIFMSYGLEPHPIKSGICTEFDLVDRCLYKSKHNVATQIRPLLNGSVGGYIYIGHLREYDNHPRKTKMGHIPIKYMTESELRATIEKVVKDYI